MGRGFDVPWIGDSIYQEGGQNTMGIGVKYLGWGDQYTMDSGFKFPWLG